MIASQKSLFKNYKRGVLIRSVSAEYLTKEEIIEKYEIGWLSRRKGDPMKMPEKIRLDIYCPLPEEPDLDDNNIVLLSKDSVLYIPGQLWDGGFFPDDVDLLEGKIECLKVLKFCTTSRYGHVYEVLTCSFRKELTRQMFWFGFNSLLKIELI